MPLAAHLRELRRRIIVSLIGIAIGAVAGWLLGAPIWEALREPIITLANEQGRAIAQINYPEVTSAFSLRLQMAITFGFILSSPIWIWQLWAFIVPALTRGEKRGSVLFLIAAVPLFIGGCVMGWLLLPYVLRLMTGFAAAEEAVLLTATTYFDFVFRFVVVIGLGFLLPVVIVLLHAIGIVSSATIRRGWRFVVLLIATFAAIVTPAADVVSMLALIVMLSLLFAAAIVVTTLIDRGRARRAAAAARAWAAEEQGA